MNSCFSSRSRVSSRPFSALFFAAAAAFLGVAAVSSARADDSLKTIGGFEAKTPAELTKAGWNGKLSTVRFSGSIPPVSSISSIFSVLQFSEDAAFAAPAGTSEHSLLIEPSADALSPISGAVRISEGKKVSISANNDSAIRVAAGNALHVGPVNSSTVVGTLTVEENSAAYGGGLRISTTDRAGIGGGLVRLENVVFSKNLAEARVLADAAADANASPVGGDGGAIYAQKPAYLELIKTSFDENKALQGGAVWGSGGTYSFHDSVAFSKNTATTAGGAIHLEGEANLTLASVNFSENNAATGGALSLFGEKTSGTATAVNFDKNTATDGAAINLRNGAALQLATSTFTANAATENGGAIFLDRATLTAATRIDSDPSTKTIGNTFTRSSAGVYGGAIYATHGSGIALTDATFTQNTAARGGAAIHLSNSSSVRLAVSAGETFRFTGNLTDGGATPNSIHTETGNVKSTGDAAAVSNIEFIATATGVFDLLDPMSGRAGIAASGDVPAVKGVINITKSGAGELVLHGTNEFIQTPNTDSATKFDLVGGKLHLAKAGFSNATTTNAAAEAAAGSLLLGENSTFTISSDATLSIAGGNRIEASTINLHRSGALIFDLGGAENPSASAAMLSLSGGSEKLLLDAVSLTLTNFANIANGTHLLIDASFTSAAITAETFHAPTNLVLDGVDGATGIRSANGSARTLALNADLTARTLTLEVADSAQQAGVATLSWTGKASDVWEHASTDANWSGKTADGLIATTFRDGDSLTFGDAPSDPTDPTTARVIEIKNTVKPASVTLTNNQTPLVFLGGSIESPGTLTLTTPIGLTLADTTASFATGIIVNNTGSSAGEHPIRLSNATLSTAAKAEFHGAVFLGKQAELDVNTSAVIAPATTGTIAAQNIEIYGYVMGEGTLSASATILNKGTIATGHGSSGRGTINLNGSVSNEGTIRVKYLADLTHDILRNTGTTNIQLSGTILYYVDAKWLENGNEVIPGFLERDTSAGSIAIAENATLSFVDPTMKGSLLDASTGSVRVTRQYNLQGVHAGLTQFVNELATRAYQGNSYAAFLLGISSELGGYDPVSVAAASPLGFGAMPSLLNRAATDSTQSLRDHVESRLAQRRSSEKRAAADTLPGAGKTPDFYVRGTGTIAHNGTGSSDPFFNSNSGSVIIGIDSLFGNATGSGNGLNAILGASLGGHFGQADFHKSTGKVNLAQYRGTLYGSYGFTSTFGKPADADSAQQQPNSGNSFGFNLLGSLSGGVSRLDTQRIILGQRCDGDVNAEDFGASIHLTGLATLSAFSLQPYVGIEHHYLFVESFLERSSSLAEGTLKLSSLEQESLQLQTGIKLAYDLSKILPARPRIVLDAGYSHEFSDTEAGIRARFANAANAARFSVNSQYASRDLYHAAASLEIASDWSTFSLGYRYETNLRSALSHSLNAEFRIRF